MGTNRGSGVFDQPLLVGLRASNTRWEPGPDPTRRWEDHTLTSYHWLDPDWKAGSVGLLGGSTEAMSLPIRFFACERRPASSLVAWVNPHEWRPQESAESVAEGKHVWVSLVGTMVGTREERQHHGSKCSHSFATPGHGIEP